jgi:hypothetical protein
MQSRLERALAQAERSRLEVVDDKGRPANLFVPNAKRQATINKLRNGLDAIEAQLRARGYED